MKRNNNLIKSFRFFLCVIAMGMSACTELEDENFGEIVASQYTPDEKDLGSLVGSAYTNWRSLMMSQTGFFYTQEITADGIVIPARPNGWVDGGLFRRLHMHQWTTQDDYARTVWSEAYAGITNTNRVLYQLETGQIPIEEGKESLIAELRALRASYYYVLIDIFGNVPIVTKFDLPEGFLPEQSSRVEVYNFIVNEINESIPHLSEKADISMYGRFNKWAAYGLLAKMYLNAQVYTGQPEWGKCIAACNEIINSGKYSLDPNHDDPFITLNQNSNEIIFAIPYDENYAGGFLMHLQTLHPANQETFNISTTPWGGDAAIPQFIETYDPEDERLEEDWLQGQQYSATGEPLVGVMDLEGEPLIFTNDVPSVDHTTEASGYRLAKYEYKQGLQFNMSNDVPLLRYADVLMMKAESLLRTGMADAAAALVTKVRERSFTDAPEKAEVTGAELLEGSSYAYGLSDQFHELFTNEGGEDIQYGRFLDELGWEFSQEGRRRQDLIRFGVFTEKSWLSHKPNGDYRVLFPIPQEEINKNPNLTQNEGY